MAKKWPEIVIKWPTHSFVCFFMHMTIGEKFTIETFKRALKVLSYFWFAFFVCSQTCDFKESSLWHHWVSVNLAHVPPLVWWFKVFYCQLPEITFPFHHRNSRIPSDHSCVHSQNGLGSNFDPWYLKFWFRILCWYSEKTLFDCFSSFAEVKKDTGFVNLSVIRGND